MRLQKTDLCYRKTELFSSYVCSHSSHDAEENKTEVLTHGLGSTSCHNKILCSRFRSRKRFPLGHEGREPLSYSVLRATFLSSSESFLLITEKL